MNPTCDVCNKDAVFESEIGSRRWCAEHLAEHVANLEAFAQRIVEVAQLVTVKPVEADGQPEPGPESEPRMWELFAIPGTDVTVTAGPGEAMTPEGFGSVGLANGEQVCWRLGAYEGDLTMRRLEDGTPIQKRPAPSSSPP